MVEYDPRVLREYAEGLYRRARRLAWSYGFLGLLLGVLAYVLLATGSLLLQQRPTNAEPSPALLVLALIGLWIGYSIGYAKGAALRLEAQRALCQVQIERHLFRIDRRLALAQPPIPDRAAETSSAPAPVDGGQKLPPQAV
ncbi:MAG: hypothetical protein D6776_11555 [Planctomycetota bacterium]|nr:MAG: hypothetical protein D6776_11555 [Planctomycetota bacterium]